VVLRYLECIAIHLKKIFCSALDKDLKRQKTHLEQLQGVRRIFNCTYYPVLKNRTNATFMQLPVQLNELQFSISIQGKH